MNKNVGLLLEGGAMRSVFSAGVLDFFMDKKVEIPNILAVSAGAYAGMNYVSGQRGRVVDAIIEPLNTYKYMGVSTFLKKGTFFDMDYLFRQVPQNESPYHFDKMLDFDGRFITSTVNCVTGENIYHEKFRDKEEFLDIFQAANSMPLIAKTTKIDGYPMLDGGMVDAIPIGKALEEGWKKIIVVFTRNESYRKNPQSNAYSRAIKMVYRKYPKFIEVLEERSKRYNNSLDQIKELEQEGKAFVFRPSTVLVENSESNVGKLMEYYNHGYETAQEKYEEFQGFLAQ